MTGTQPLIYTTHGNLPADSLTYSTRWEEPRTEDGSAPPWTKFIETYTLDGEVVRESVHVLHRQGLSASLTAGSLN